MSASPISPMARMHGCASFSASMLSKLFSWVFDGPSAEAFMRIEQKPWQTSLQRPCSWHAKRLIGGDGGGTKQSVQPLQPSQVHLSSQACVLSSQNGLHTGAGAEHSVQL